MVMMVSGCLLFIFELIQHKLIIAAFQVEPSFGTLAPRVNVEVSVTFRPKQPQSYQSRLTLDIIDVKDSAFSLPIRAR